MSAQALDDVLALRMAGLRRLAARLGWLGLAGAALLAASAVFYGGTLRGMQQRIDLVAAQAGRPALPAAAAQRGAEAAELRQFVEFFPEAREATQWLARIYALARREQVQLARGEYRLGEVEGLELLQYRIVLPVRAPYPQVRRFATALLREVPAAALTQLVIERQRIGEAAVDARLELTLFLRPDAATVQTARAKGGDRP